MEQRTPIVLLDLYRRHGRRFLVSVGALCVVVVAYSFCMPQKYTSTATIMPPDGKSGEGGLSSLLAGAPIAIGIGANENKASLVFIEILKSRTLRQLVIDSLGLDRYPMFAGRSDEAILNTLEDAVVLEVNKTGTVSIEVTSKTAWFPWGDDGPAAAKLASMIANTYRTTLDRLNREKTVTMARRTRTYVERVLAANKHTLDSLQDVMQRFQQDNGVLAMDSQVEAMAQNAGNLGAELAKAEIELALVQREFQPSAPQVGLLERKTGALREQYERLQNGGLVARDGFALPIDSIPSLTRTWLNLTRDLKIREQINVFLESQRMQEMIQEAKDTPTVIALDVAPVPTIRTSPSRLLMVILTILMSTLIYLGIVPAIEVYRRRITAPAGGGEM